MSMSEFKPISERSRILFYDGDCGLCAQSVRFFLGIDRHKRLSFAPLQGDTAQGYLPANLRDAQCLSTVVYRCSDSDGQSLFLRSEAVARALIDVGGVWGFLGRLLLLTPTPMRDWGYNLIAKNRLKFFPNGACALPTEQARERLLP
jgi:predicted DCC family thiol-disulfide oxidoreductase YuxK